MARFKHYGVKEGKIVKATYCGSGTSQKGFQWSCFKYCANSKDKETGRYQEQARYEIWVANGVIVNNGDQVQIERIISVEQKHYTYKEKHSSIISMWCNVKIVKKADEEEQEVDLENVDEFDVDINELDLM